MLGPKGPWWKVEKIHQQPGATIGWFSNSFRLDVDGKPHVAYYYRSPQGNGYCIYATRGPGGWSRETVAAGNKLLSASLEFNARNRPIISYFDYDQAGVWLARKSAAGWKSERIPDYNEVGWKTSLDLGRKGTPHLTYWDRTEGVLKYAVGYWNGPVWNLRPGCGSDRISGETDGITVEPIIEPVAAPQPRSLDGN